MVMENMGKQKLVDKAIRPEDVVRALMAGDITFAQAQQMYNGNIPIGDYKGAAAALDLDLLVKQPLVQAEWQHILGILDAREAGHDLQATSIAALAVVGTTAVAQLTVPTGAVWFISTVQLFSAALGAGAEVGANWYCSLWTDRIGSLGYGQPFHAAEQMSGLNAAMTVTDEFWYTAPILGIINKAVMLRAPGGTVFTATFAVRTGNAVNTIAPTLQLYGFIGKALVD